MSSPTSVGWQPVCSQSLLLQRARLNARIRDFFAHRGVLEVETPLLGRSTVTDPALHPFETIFRLPGQSTGTRLFLQNSPDFAMKRLLAAGSGSIYQLGKAFRNEESGRCHNPEFTLLEWYRTGFDLAALLDEVEALINVLAADLLVLDPPERLTYEAACQRYLGLHPISDSLASFAAFAEARGLSEARELCGEDRGVWLDLLFSYFVQPYLGINRLTSIYRYPAFMPSLARVSEDDPRWVERAEVFLAGMELGNGFHELADAQEQARRFDQDLQQRRVAGLPEPEPDGRLLGALEAGLPDCAGIALGLDRLLMVLTGCDRLDDVLAFPLVHA